MGVARFMPITSSEKEPVFFGKKRGSNIGQCSLLQMVVFTIEQGAKMPVNCFYLKTVTLGTCAIHKYG